MRFCVVWGLLFVLLLISWYRVASVKQFRAFGSACGLLRDFITFYAPLSKCLLDVYFMIFFFDIVFCGILKTQLRCSLLLWKANYTAFVANSCLLLIYVYMCKYIIINILFIFERAPGTSFSHYQIFMVFIHRYA